MRTVLSYRHTRYTAIVMLFVWLMTLGIGIANACWVSDAHGHAGSAQLVQATSYSEADEHAPGEAICLTVCAADQTIAIKVKLLDSIADLHSAPAAWAPALTIAVVDLNDRSAPMEVPTWREPPVSIRFLRLTI